MGLVEWSGKSRLTCTLRLCLGLFPMLMPAGSGLAWPQKRNECPIYMLAIIKAEKTGKTAQEKSLENGSTIR